MITLDWKSLFIVGLLGITTAGVLLMIHGSREQGRAVAWSQFRLHLGIALLISAITIILIDLQLKREVEAGVNQIPNVMLTTVCQGDRAVESAVKEQIMDDPIRFSDAEIIAELRPDSSPNPQHSVWIWTTTFKVRNISDAEVDWDFCPTVTSDLPGKPKIHISKPTVRAEGQEADIATYEANLMEDQSGIEARQSYKTTIRLKPGVVYHVSVTRAADQVLDKGYFTHYFTKITSRVKFHLTVDPGLFAVKVEPYAPGGEVADLKSPLIGAGAIPHICYEISKTLLPYQGFQVYWTYKGAKATKAGRPAKTTSLRAQAQSSEAR